MKYVYLIMGGYDHENSEVIKAFETEDAAQCFLDLCNKYEENTPRCPAIDSILDEAIVLESYRDIDWIKLHPAGDSWYADRYYILTKQLE